MLRLDGDLETGADGFLRDLTLTGSLGDPAGEPVVLPVPGGRTRLQSGVLHVNFGDASRWTGLVVLDRLDAADIHMEDVTLRLGGLAQNLEDPARRNVTVTVEGLATGVWHEDPEVARALGERIDLFADIALPPEAPIEVRQLQLSGNGLSVFSAGQLADMVYTGRSAVRIADLGVLRRHRRPAARRRDRPAGQGSVSPLSGGFDLAFDGGATDLALGDPRLDRLLAGETTLAGRAVRDEAGFRTEDLRIGNAQFSFASNGQVSTSRTDIGFDARARRPRDSRSAALGRADGVRARDRRRPADPRRSLGAGADGQRGGRALDQPRGSASPARSTAATSAAASTARARSTGWCSTSPATSRSPASGGRSTGSSSRSGRTG